MIVSQRDDKRIGYITWDEAIDLGTEFLDRYQNDDCNTSVGEAFELSIAIMYNMNDCRRRVENHFRSSCQLQSNTLDIHI